MMVSSIDDPLLLTSIIGPGLRYSFAVYHHDRVPYPGHGLPATATYIINSTWCALAQMHLPYEGVLVGAVALLPIHMFVLYYGVLADVTPPVALAAYAASGIAKSNQFWTGVEAFKISLNKLMVPFAFVYSPSILLHQLGS
jgi:TRAP-type uncharacterized transport system fused permease subunit